MSQFAGKQFQIVTRGGIRKGSYMFCSGDKIGADHIIEAAPSRGKEDRSWFTYDEKSQVWRNPTYKGYLFASTGVILDGGHQLELDTKNRFLKEWKSRWQIKYWQNKGWTIYNVGFKAWLTMSAKKKDDDNMFTTSAKTAQYFDLKFKSMGVVKKPVKTVIKTTAITTTSGKGGTFSGTFVHKNHKLISTVWGCNICRKQYKANSGVGYYGCASGCDYHCCMGCLGKANHNHKFNLYSGSKPPFPSNCSGVRTYNGWAPLDVTHMMPTGSSVGVQVLTKILEKLKSYALKMIPGVGFILAKAFQLIIFKAEESCYLRVFSEMQLGGGAWEGPVTKGRFYLIVQDSSRALATVHSIWGVMAYWIRVRLGRGDVRYFSVGYNTGVKANGRGKKLLQFDTWANLIKGHGMSGIGNTISNFVKSVTANVTIKNNSCEDVTFYSVYHDSGNLTFCGTTGSRKVTSGGGVNISKSKAVIRKGGTGFVKIVSTKGKSWSFSYCLQGNKTGNWWTMGFSNPWIGSWKMEIFARTAKNDDVSCKQAWSKMGQHESDKSGNSTAQVIKYEGKYPRVVLFTLKDTR